MSSAALNLANNDNCSHLACLRPRPRDGKLGFVQAGQETKAGCTCKQHQHMCTVQHMARRYQLEDPSWPERFRDPASFQEALLLSDQESIDGTQ